MVFEIGGVSTALEIPGSLTFRGFLAFSTRGKKNPDMRISLRERKYEDNPAPAEGEKALRAAAQTIFKRGEDTHFLFAEEDSIHAMSSNGNYSECELSTEHAIMRDTEHANNLSISVLNRTRMLFTGKLALHGGLIMHASVVEYRGGAVIFSAESGVGKSTHAELWRRQYPGEARVINGDNAIIRINGADIELFGSPWCGTSGIYENARLPLLGIVFLEQSSENSACALSPAEAFMRLSARCFMPAWDAGLVSHVMDTVEKIIHRVPCRLLRCRPDAESVAVIKNSLGL